MNNFITTAILSIILLSCRSENSEQAEAANSETTIRTDEVVLTDAQFRMAGITFGSVERKMISGSFRASGVLDVPPQQMVSVSVPMGGFLKATEMLQGKRVKKGELIAVIENPEYIQMQQDYLEAKSGLQYAKSDYERQQNLEKENINAQKTVQQARANFESLDARVKALREKIRVSGINLAAVEKGDIQSAIHLYSPISGFVTEVNVNIGKFVTPSDVLFEIVDTEHLHAELTVFEKDVPKLQIGQKVRFTLANESTERTAAVYLIGREISKDRTARVHCHIDKEDIHLLPGMYLKAVVETGKNEVAALPDEAIVDFEGTKFIFVPAGDGRARRHPDSASAEPQQPGGRRDTDGGSEEHRFRMIAIQTGNKDMGYTEVSLPEGIDTSKVVVKGAYALLSQMKNSEEE